MTKQQHTIPQFYLKSFLQPGWVYRRNESKPRFVNNPRQVAVKRNYYGKNASEEKYMDQFNSHIESKGAPALNKLIRSPEKITVDDWIILSYLFANLYVRTPIIVEEMRATTLNFADGLNRKASQMMEKMKDAISKGEDLSQFTYDGPRSSSPRFSLDEINNEATKLGFKKGHLGLLAGLFSAIPNIAESIQKMTFLILDAPKDSFFITSDRPIHLQSRITGSRVGAGWANPDAFGAIALDPYHYLAMFYHEEVGVASKEAEPQRVLDCNAETMRFADEEMYSLTECPEALDWMKG